MDSHVDTSTNRKLKRAYSQSKSSRQTRRLKQAENEEEKRLTALLFGNSFVSNPASSAWHDDDEDEYNDEENQVTDTTDDANESSFFQIDRLGYDVPVDDDDNNNEDYNGEPEDENSVDSNDDNLEEENEDEQEEIVDSAAAWVDDDDRQVSVSLVSTSGRLKKLRSSLSEDVLDGNDYQQRLRERFQNSTQYTSKPDWAKIHTIPSSRIEENAPTASNILSSTIPLISSTPTYLPPNILQVIRRPDVNLSDPNQSVVQAVNFHPGSDEDTPLLFTAGLDKTLRFFRVVDDKTSEKIHGIHFPNLPIYSASFLGDTGSVVVSGRRKFFYIYDAIAGSIDKVPGICGREEKSLEKHVVSPDGKLIAFIGNDGFIILVEASSKLWVGNMKMNGSCRSLCFSPDGKEMLSSGSDGDVYRWDLRTKKCISKFSNEDGTISSTLSMSPSYVAVGSESGVVNLYDNASLEERSHSKRTPIKQIMNLKTSVDFMKFNTNGEILAMSTRREKDSLKLLHTKSKTVFSNWPTTKTPLGYVWSLDFSPGSKFMAIGNDKGKCLLYKLNHYHE